MDTSKQFQILVRRKIPYLTEGLESIVGSLFLILFLYFFIMLPTKYAPDEMATAYYILVVPEGLKRLFAFALLGLIIFTPLYFLAKFKRPAMLTLSDDTISIKGKNFDIMIPIKKIKKIYFNDLKTATGQPKNKMQIVIRQTNQRSTVFLLANYEDAEIALDTLSKIDNAELDSFEHSMSAIHDDE